MGWMGAVLKSGTSWRHLLYSVMQLRGRCSSFAVTVTFWA